MNPKLRQSIIIVFFFLAVGSVYSIFQIRFTFDFEQFFPKGDPDLEYFLDFRKNFETDDNFLLIALRRENGIFNQQFLNEVHALTLAARRLDNVTQSVSITNTEFPLKLPFGGFSSIEAIHRNEPNRYQKDSLKIIKDERLIGTLVSKDCKTAVVFLKTIDNIQQEPAEQLISEVTAAIDQYSFEEHHILGRAYFQKEIVAMQKREIIVSALISSFLVGLIMFFLFRRFWGIAIALFSIGLGMLLFMGLLGLLGRELNAMAALYPVLMIIVGTSDVIHIMSKYIDELHRGNDKKSAIWTTVKEIGVATLLTSLTTAVGFATLMTSRIGPIQEFGLNAAIGVLVAYVTVIFFTTALLSLFEADQLIQKGKGATRWDGWLDWAYNFTLNKTKGIAIGVVGFLLLCFWGISMISTNYRLVKNMPTGKKLTEDFIFFEKEFSGFRPYEFAITVVADSVEVDDFAVIRQIDQLEKFLKRFDPIKSVTSLTMVYKSLNRASYGDRVSYYKMPESESKFNKYKKIAARFPQRTNVLVSKDKKKTRVAAKMLDIGAENIKVISDSITGWIDQNIDTSLIVVRQTGTGMIIDKNAKYVRDSLISGLGIAMLIISLLMAFLFKNLKMVLISLVPNVFPLLFAGALLGFLGIELDAGIAIVFAIVFGIAVDDTIHFLSKFKLCLNKGMDIESAIQATFSETGKPIILTSIILFFGFLVMLFSIHPPSVTVGLLISATLVSAVVGDLLIIPLLIRYFLK